jgi:hypothetical protein
LIYFCAYFSTEKIIDHIVLCVELREIKLIIKQTNNNIPPGRGFSLN